jgi:phosphoserine phosphatase
MKKEIKLAVFDFDSTLMDGETIDSFAEALGLKEEVARITHESMSGTVKFFDGLSRRVALLEGLEHKKVEEIAQNLPYMNGAKEIIKYLKDGGATVVCFSGGFRCATSYAKDILGFDADFSNTLHQKDGILTGKVGGEMMFDWSKGDMLKRLQAILGVSKENTLVAGDGANDLSMFPYADYKVAFCGKEVLRKEANIVIDIKDLEEIKKYI